MARYGVTLLVGILVVLSVAPPGTPLQLSYVYSDSMEPTIDRNDGYLLVPAGSVHEGDVVTFWSSQRGEYVTHRVVERTDAGLVTQGDANPETDQAAGYAHVEREDVVGEVLTVAGEPVVVPGLGGLVSTLQANRLAVVAGALALLFALGVLGEDEANRGQQLTGELLRPVFAVTLIAVVALVLLGASANQFTYVATAHDSGSPRTLTVGEAANETVVAWRTDSPLTHHVLSTRGMTILDQERNATAITATARVPPPASTGPHTTEATLYQYPAVLPERTVRALHRVHPLAAASATGAVVVGLLYALYRLFVDPKEPVRPVTNWRWRRLWGDDP